MPLDRVSAEEVTDGKFLEVSIELIVVEFERGVEDAEQAEIVQRLQTDAGWQLVLRRVQGA